MYTMAYQEVGFNGFMFKEFQNINQYYKFHSELEDSHHYEVISGKQCLFFDFEGKIDVHETDFPELASVIQEKFRDFPLRIDCYTSSGLEKISYHIIVKGIYFENHLATKKIADEVIFSLSDVNILRTLYDASVYTSKRNLRLVGSRKPNSTRIKKFLKTIYTNGIFSKNFNELDKNSTNDVLNFRLSLASDIFLCVFVKIDIPKIEEKEYEKTDFNEEELQNINTFLDQTYPGVFKKERSDKNFFKLIRSKPHMCNVCGRTHENDNAFIFKHVNKVFFGCHRDNSKNHTLIEPERVFEVKFVPRTIVRNENPAEEVCEKIAKKLIRAFPF
jgi:hypothetical protein